MCLSADCSLADFRKHVPRNLPSLIIGATALIYSILVSCSRNFMNLLDDTIFLKINNRRKVYSRISQARLALFLFYTHN